MIIIQEKVIENIPILEIVQEENKDKMIPTVVCYHGWTGSKENCIHYGAMLAKNGMRAILPDQLYHGERKTSELNGFELWEIIGQNVKEFPTLVGAYQKENLVDNKIGAIGFSMGGMTTYALLKHFPFLYAAASLMGNPNPVEFAKWSLTSTWMKDKPAVELTPDLMDKYIPMLQSLSLADNPETIAGRPVLIWHGLEDKKVPYELNYAFYEKIKDESYASRVKWIETPEVPHFVTFKAIEASVEFLKESLVEE